MNQRKRRDGVVSRRVRYVLTLLVASGLSACTKSPDQVPDSTSTAIKPAAGALLGEPGALPDSTSASTTITPVQAKEALILMVEATPCDFEEKDARLLRQSQVRNISTDTGGDELIKIYHFQCNLSKGTFYYCDPGTVTAPVSFEYQGRFSRDADGKWQAKCTRRTKFSNR
jgi:hypothetical protein